MNSFPQITPSNPYSKFISQPEQEIQGELKLLDESTMFAINAVDQIRFNLDKLDFEEIIHSIEELCQEPDHFEIVKDEELFTMQLFFASAMERQAFQEALVIQSGLNDLGAWQHSSKTDLFGLKLSEQQGARLLGRDSLCYVQLIFKKIKDIKKVQSTQLSERFKDLGNLSLVNDKMNEDVNTEKNLKINNLVEYPHLANLALQIKGNKEFLDSLKNDVEFQNLLIVIRRGNVGSAKLLEFLTGKASFEDLMMEKWAIDLFVIHYPNLIESKWFSNSLKENIAQKFEAILSIDNSESSQIISDKIDALKMAIEQENCGEKKLYISGLDCQNQDLNGADLQGANLEGANLKNANLKGANLRGANLQRANLKDAKLDGANLEEADLRDANLVWTQLLGANLLKARSNDSEIMRLIMEQESFKKRSLLLMGQQSPSSLFHSEQFSKELILKIAEHL